VVCRSVTVEMRPAKRLNRSKCRLGCGLGWAQGTMYYTGSRSPSHPIQATIFSGKDMPGHALQHSAVSCAKMAEAIEIPFVWVVRRLGWAEGSIRWGAHCRHLLANATKRSMCGSDAAVLSNYFDHLLLCRVTWRHHLPLC